MKVLVADHDAQTLQSVQAELSALPFDCEVKGFDRPISLFKYWNSHSEQVALVITPVVSNVADGFRILEGAAASHLSAPVFLTTQSQSEELKQLSSIHGASGFLCKPITCDSVMLALRKWQSECEEMAEAPCCMPCVFKDCARRMQT